MTKDEVGAALLARDVAGGHVKFTSSDGRRYVVWKVRGVMHLRETGEVVTLEKDTAEEEGAATASSL